MARRAPATRLWALAIAALALAAPAAASTRPSARPRGVHGPRRTSATGARPAVTTPHPLSYPPVVVAIATPHYFGDGYPRGPFPCPLAGGGTFNCTFADDSTILPTADALWYHLPTSPASGPYRGGSRRARPDQVTIAATMESAVYYPGLVDPSYMARFDVEASYRLAADVMLSYLNEEHVATWKSATLIPFAEKENAVAYLSSNCAAPSGRDDIAGRLMAVPGALPVHALGRCRNNRPSPPSREQGDTLKRYRFCLAMENSIADDYVSEKVYAAMSAGCTPIYYGPADMTPFLPAAAAIIDWRVHDTPEKLAAEIHRLNANEAVYNTSHAWRYEPESAWAPAFQVLRARLAKEDPQCGQCRAVAEKRAAGFRRED